MYNATTEGPRGTNSNVHFVGVFRFLLSDEYVHSMEGCEEISDSVTGNITTSFLSVNVLENISTSKA